MIYTSLSLSKKLKEGGCKLESEYIHCEDENGYFFGKLFPDKTLPFREGKEPFYVCKSYDLLWDVCIKHADKFFNIDKTICSVCFTGESNRKNGFKCECGNKYQQNIGFENNICAHHILSLLQQNKKKEAELYIEKHCIFLNK